MTAQRHESDKDRDANAGRLTLPWKYDDRGTRVPMDKQTYADATALVFGTPDALDHIDAIVAALIVGYIVARRPPWGKADRVALVAIAALAEHAPDVARQLIDELHG